jgi:hypothetical protein
MVSLARLMQQTADLFQCIRHVIPRLDDGAAARPPGRAIQPGGSIPADRSEHKPAR